MFLDVGLWSERTPLVERWQFRNTCLQNSNTIFHLLCLLFIFPIPANCRYYLQSLPSVGFIQKDRKDGSWGERLIRSGLKSKLGSIKQVCCAPNGDYEPCKFLSMHGVKPFCTNLSNLQAWAGMKAFLGKRRKYLVFQCGIVELYYMKGEACCLHSSPTDTDHITMGEEKYGANWSEIRIKANHKSDGSVGDQISFSDIQAFSGNVTNGTTVFKNIILCW